VPRPLPLLVLLLAPALAAGCGYALVGQATNVPADIGHVYVAPLENLTPRAQVEEFLTRAIAEELVNRRRFDVVASEEAADAVIHGSVTGFGVTPVAFDAEGRATEYEVSITASMTFQRVPGDEVLWSNERYIFRQSYPVDTQELEYFDRENLALESAADRFAETVVTDLLEGF
jgi:outer membrane lipopolysaccharide assembly protein LptE/RlpB